MSATLPHARTDAVPSSPVIPSDVRRYWLVRLGFGLIWVSTGIRRVQRTAGRGRPGAIVDRASDLQDLQVLTAGTGEDQFLIGLGIVFGLLIWGVGEGFGGPYMSGATDIGSAIIYSVVFAALLAVPRHIRAAAPAADTRLVARWPGLAPLTFQSAPRTTDAHSGS